MHLIRIAIAVAGFTLVNACSPTWSTADVSRPGAAANPESTASTDAQQTNAQQQVVELPKTDPLKIVVTEADITDRPYTSLGDISVTVNKTTLFHPDPTKELVAQKLREEAAGLGADAVVLVRYGTVGIGLFTWGSLDGRGRAVAFTKN
jgi:hypothetical protein